MSGSFGREEIRDAAWRCEKQCGLLAISVAGSYSSKLMVLWRSGYANDCKSFSQGFKSPRHLQYLNRLLVKVKSKMAKGGSASITAIVSVGY